MAENEGEKDDVAMGEFQTGVILLVPHDRGPIVVIDIPKDIRDAFKMQFSEELTPRILYSAICDLKAGLETDNAQTQMKRAIAEMVQERMKAGKIVDMMGKRIN